MMGALNAIDAIDPETTMEYFMQEGVKKLALKMIRGSAQSLVKVKKGVADSETEEDARWLATNDARLLVSRWLPGAKPEMVLAAIHQDPERFLQCLKTSIPDDESAPSDSEGFSGMLASPDTRAEEAGPCPAC